MIYLRILLSLILLNLYIDINVIGHILFDTKLLRTYLKSINDQLDVSVKPCDNFGKYACGKLQKKKPPKETLLELANRFLIEETPRTVAEERARDFYLSCRNSKNITKLFTQIDTLKLIKQWPIKRNFNKKEVAELMGTLAALGPNGIIDVDTKDWHKDKIKLRPGNSRRDSIDDMINTMKNFGASAEDIVPIVKGVENIMNQIDSAFKDKEKLDADKPLTILFKDLSETIIDFDWYEFFKGYNSELHINFTIFEDKYIEIPKINAFKEVMNYIKSAPITTLVNYITWKYIMLVKYSDCEEKMGFFYPVLIVNLINEQMIQIDIDKYLDVLNNFDTNFDEIRGTFNSPSNLYDERIYPRRTLYQNYRSLGNSKTFENVYKQFRMHPNEFYQNIIDIAHTTLIDYLRNGTNSTFDKFRRTWITLQDADIDIIIKNKPVLYYFINVNYKLWNLLTSIDNTGRNKVVSPECMPHKNKMDPMRQNKNMKYTNMYIANKMALRDFMLYLRHHNNILTRSHEVLKGFNMNYLKAYFLALAQNKCLENQSIDLDNDDLLIYFKQSEEFKSAFECKETDAMNDQICQGPSSFQNMFYFGLAAN